MAGREDCADAKPARQDKPMTSNATHSIVRRMTLADLLKCMFLMIIPPEYLST